MLDAHFRLQSGFHSRYFLRFGQLAFLSANARRIAQLFLETLDHPLEAGTVILAAETAPRYLAEAIAAETRLRFVLAGIGEMRKPEKRLLSNGTLEGASSVLVVTDVLTSGGSVAPLVELAREAGVERPRVLAFATLHADGPNSVFERLNVQGSCLLQARWPIFEPGDCDLCRRGSELLPGFEFI